MVTQPKPHSNVRIKAASVREVAEIVMFALLVSVLCSVTAIVMWGL
jgi:hypothetical protein